MPDVQVKLIGVDSFCNSVRQPIEPIYSAIITLGRRDTDPLLAYICSDNHRTRDVIACARSLSEHATYWQREKLPVAGSYVFQGDDGPKDAYSIGFGKKLNYNKLCLVPDLYFFNTTGYAEVLKSEPLGWSSRKDRIVWRGSSTGGILNVSNFTELPRYKLCKLGSAFGEKADFGLINIVQAVDDPTHRQIVERVQNDGLLKSFIPIRDFQENKYIVHIAGNAAAWGLIEKLRLACCTLVIESQWLQWFDEHLRPWEHYVPVKSDLSDFASKVDWCFENDREAEQIGRRGRDFALRYDYASQMQAANERIYPYLEDLEIH